MNRILSLTRQTSTRDMITILFSNLVSSIHPYFPPFDLSDRALRAWTINCRGKHLVRNLQDGCVDVVGWCLTKRKSGHIYPQKWKNKISDTKKLNERIGIVNKWSRNPDKTSWDQASLCRSRLSPKKIEESLSLSVFFSSEKWLHRLDQAHGNEY